MCFWLARDAFGSGVGAGGGDEAGETATIGAGFTGAAAGGGGSFTPSDPAAKPNMVACDAFSGAGAGAASKSVGDAPAAAEGATTAPQWVQKPLS